MNLLLDSFDEAVDLGRGVVVPKQRPQATMSGESTRQSAAPSRNFRVSYTAWNAFSRAALKTVEDDRHLSSDRSPKWNDARYIDVEADVAEASSLYLLYAVDAVLRKYLRTSSSSMRTLRQHTISKEDSTVQVNRVWGLADPGTPNMHSCFALLDFKRSTLINPNEFNPSATWNTDCATDPLRYPKSGFKGNAAILMKQAVSYSRQYQTRFIAFFDWHTLVLIVLPVTEGLKGGEYCLTTVITDRKEMRRALLGFLIRAHNAQGTAIKNYSDILGSGNSSHSR